MSCALQLLHMRDMAVDCSVLPLEVKTSCLSVSTPVKEHLVSCQEHARPFNCFFFHACRKSCWLCWRLHP